jgi:outer membrane receptor protein involved in Fe transport
LEKQLRRAGLGALKIKPCACLAALQVILILGSANASQHEAIGKAPLTNTRTFSGTIITDRNESVAGASIVIRYPGGEQTIATDAGGKFKCSVPNEPLTVTIEGKNLDRLTMLFGSADATQNLQIKVKYVVPPIHESVVIQAADLEPGIDRRNEVLYRDTFFGRDDQMIETLNAGINVGQHEGGGKSLEFRRFGYNLDHGGVSGGLKIMVDDIQQNQASQGHGQGYLGQLKSLTPELVQDVEIINGPFSAQYGDFSGLGVVQIRLRESLPDQLTLRLQGGSFHEGRTFVAYSPRLDHADSFIAYEKSYIDGPFKNPGRYSRDNVTGNYIWRFENDQALGFKLNLGRNDFYSSGQIPLDLVSEGVLNRFGFIDPSDGGRVRTGIGGAYYRKEWKDGSTLKLDGYMTRSLFDLYSDFTFFLADRVKGDGIQQHDSRLQEGGTVQYIHPYKLFGLQSLLVAGANVMASQINLGLYQERDRIPLATTTSADAHITNPAVYIQQGIDLASGRVHVDLGLRYDYFRFVVDDKLRPEFSGTKGQGRFEPKVNFHYRPWERIPIAFYLSYGRGVNSQDARGVVRGAIKDLPAPGHLPTPDQGNGQGVGPPVATTDFYQAGVASNFSRMSVSADLFFIDHSNEQVYIPDDGTIVFAGPSRSYGYELKTSIQITRTVALTGGMTQVMNAFFRGTAPRVYTDSAPHIVANGGLLVGNIHGFSGSLLWRHAGNYRLDGLDANIRASGLDVVDLGVRRRLNRWIDASLSVDNLLNKRYLETQNYFESRVRSGLPAVFRIHGTPGYPMAVTGGVTLHFCGK